MFVSERGLNFKLSLSPIHPTNSLVLPPLDFVVIHVQRNAFLDEDLGRPLCLIIPIPFFCEPAF